MATYIEINKPAILKSSGKTNVDEWALKKLYDTLRSELAKKLYAVDLPDPKPTKGYVVDPSIVEIGLVPKGKYTLVGIKAQASAGTWPKSSMFGFVTVSKKIEDSTPTDKALESLVQDTAKAAAIDLANSVDTAIQSKP